MPHADGPDLGFFALLQTVCCRFYPQRYPMKASVAGKLSQKSGGGEHMLA